MRRVGIELVFVNIKEPRIVKCTALCFSKLLNLSAADQTDHEDQNDRAHDCNQKAGKVEASDALYAEETRKPTPEKRANDAHYDIGDGSHSGILSHDDACDPTSKSPKDDPCNEIHFFLQVIK